MSAMTLGQAALSFAALAALMTLTPGLDTAIVLRAAVRGGARAGWATAGGVCAGVLIWGVAGALGVSAALAASRTAFEILRVAGAAYLTWLGARLLLRAARGRPYGRRAGRPASPADGAQPSAQGPPTSGVPPVPARALPDGSVWADARLGLGTNLLNPKVGAFYLAVLPQFLVEGVPPAAVGILLAGIHVLEGLAWFAVLIGAAHAARAVLTGDRVQRALDALTGAVLVGFGARLAWEAWDAPG